MFTVQGRYATRIVVRFVLQQESVQKRFSGDSSLFRISPQNVSKGDQNSSLTNAILHDITKAPKGSQLLKYQLVPELCGRRTNMDAEKLVVCVQKIKRIKICQYHPMTYQSYLTPELLNYAILQGMMTAQRSHLYAPFSLP